MALLYKPTWPLLVCANPNSGPDHHFTFWLPWAAFVCDGCGVVVAAAEAGALIDWWGYIGAFAGQREATANKWN